MGVLKTQAIKINAEILKLDYGQNSLQTNLSGDEISWDYLISELHKRTSHTLSLLVLILIVMLIIHKIYKRCCKSKIGQITFQLEFASKIEYVYVNAMVLQGSRKDYKVQAKDFITNIEVTGTIRPMLKFKWSTLKITDEATLNEFKIKNKIPVSITQSRNLKRIIRGNFKVNPVFISSQGKVHRIPVMHIDEKTEDNVVQIE